jgi:hypothetical protein
MKHETTPTTNAYHQGYRDRDLCQRHSYRWRLDFDYDDPDDTMNGSRPCMAVDVGDGQNELIDLPFLSGIWSRVC